MTEQPNIVEEFIKIAAMQNLSPEEISLYSFSVTMESNKKIVEQIKALEEELNKVKSQLKSLDVPEFTDDWIRNKIQDELSSEYVNNMIYESVDNIIENTDFSQTFNQYIDDYDFSYIIQEEIADYDYSSIVQEEISELDLDDKIDQSVRNYDFDEYISDSLTEYIENGLEKKIEEMVKNAKLKELQNSTDKILAATQAFKDRFKNLF